MAPTGSELFAGVEIDTTEYKYAFSRARVFREAGEAFSAEGNAERARECDFEDLVFRAHATDAAPPGERFGPEYIAADGTTYPDLNNLPDGLQAYVASRAQTTTNPIHRARYCDFLWDKFKDFRQGRAAVDAYLACVPHYRAQHWDLEQYDAFRRTAQLIRLLNVKAMVPAVEAEIMNSLLRFEADERLPLVSRIAEVLLELPGGNTNLRQQAADLVRRTADSFRTQGNFNAHRFTLKGLMAFHKALGDQESARKANIEIGESFELEGDSRLPGSNFAAGHFYALALQHYSNIGHPEPLDRLKVKAQEANRQAVETEFKALGYRFSLPKEHVEEIIQHFVADGLEPALERIALAFIPSLQGAQERLQAAREGTVFHMLVRPVAVTARGNITSSPKTDEEADAFHLYQHFGREIQFNAVLYLAPILERLKAEHGLTCERLTAYVTQAWLFRDRDHTLLAYSLQRYFESDFIGSIHVLIPQVEAGFRHLLQRMGVATTSADSEHPGVTSEKTFGTLLSEPALREVFGPDVIAYLRVVLSDPRGYNLRNEVAHGLAEPGAFNRANAETLLHIILLLTLLRPQVQDSGTTGPAENTEPPQAP